MPLLIPDCAEDTAGLDAERRRYGEQRSRFHLRCETAAGDPCLPLGKQIAMHIAAAFPLALNAEGLDPEMLARERAIAAEKAAESGKPANIVD